MQVLSLQKVRGVLYVEHKLNNPMPLEKVAFLKDVLVPAAIRIQRWYLKHFYRPGSRYVNTVRRRPYWWSYSIRYNG